MTKHHCPRWDELPTIPLYLDQLVMVIEAAVAPIAADGEPAVTKAMINNYVKQKLVTPPEQKKYKQEQIALLIVISLLKRAFSMSEIRALIDATTEVYGVEAAYDLFCERLEGLLGTVAEAGTLTLDVPEDAEALPLMDMTLAALVCKLRVQAQIRKLAVR